MRTLMISLGNCADGVRHSATAAAFELGPAWHGGQSAIFVRTAKSLEDAHRHVQRAIDENDLLVTIELPDDAEVAYSGMRFDENGFDQIFPASTEVSRTKA
ncbi:hypothetical protein ACO2Q1_15380 [Brevundimonas sp. VNH65]|uniref:hypothetical protein n=1 Tax=Brevundimonas sp. VNH65 TaxID=3400917 RepID=UPI003BFB99C2